MQQMGLDMVDGRRCWDGNAGKEYEMGMFPGSTLAHVGIGVKRVCGKWMVDAGSMEERWKHAWGCKDPRWI